MDEDLDPVVSDCPKCTEERIQCYSRDEVIEPLRSGAPIKANCDVCGLQWDLTAQERAELAELVAG